jgi:di/tricarboxylate transporter
MTTDQILILTILVATMAMFIWGRWRHDMVALGALLACVLVGLVPRAEAFLGFGHPAVITVACVLVLSRALQTSGAVDLLADRVLPRNAGPWLSIASLSMLAAVLSAFMNNVGALALLMPIAIQIAKRQDLPPGKVLMPLAFASILGGMTTLIGTPPNLIVAGFRQETGHGSFTMFDFAPVGLAVAIAGILFMLAFGRWLIPVRRRAGAEDFDTGSYLTEARVEDESKAAGMTVRAAEQAIEEFEAQIIALIRGDTRLNAPHPGRRIRAGDILVIEAEPRALADALTALDVRLEEDKTEEPQDTDSADGQRRAAGDDDGLADADLEDQDGIGKDREHDDDGKDDDQEPDEIVLMELVVMPSSSVVGRSARDLMLRTRYGINLLAVSRQGSRSLARLRTFRPRPSDVLLVQGPLDVLQDFAAQSGCVPLADRALRLPPRPREALLTGLLMLVAVIAASFGLLPAAIAFAGGVLVAMATRMVPPRKVYEAVDWPVIVLLGALMPVAGAMDHSGTADLIAGFLMTSVAGGDPVFAVVLLLIVTMTLSDFMNNAATAAVMCPIALSTATTLGVSADPYLMAVAVGASCAFLTPIGHQNNTLILGPGGFRFGDYWKLGLPVEIVVIAIGVPMILWVWPF